MPSEKTSKQPLTPPPAKNWLDDLPDREETAWEDFLRLTDALKEGREPPPE